MLTGATIANKAHLALARVVAASFRRHHPGSAFLVLLADDVEACFDPAGEPGTVISLAELGLPPAERQALCFRYGAQALSYALTPFLLSHLLERGHARVAFIKQESLVTAPLLSLAHALDAGSVVLTPHLLAPLEGPDRCARELNVLQSGVFNGGIVGVRDDADARAFLAWWRARVAGHCRHDVAAGMHFEQRWLDLAPSVCANFAALRDPGCNIGHWNVAERPLRWDGGRAFVEASPVCLVRFSGYDTDHPQVLTRHSARLTREDIGSAAAFWSSYHAELMAAGHAQTRTWPYAFSRFDNGVPIPEVARALYLAQGEAAPAFGDPFASASPGGWYRWFSAADAHGLSPLWRAIHARRRDLRQRWPVLEGAAVAEFLAWTCSSGAREHDIDAAFLPQRH